MTSIANEFITSTLREDGTLVVQVAEDTLREPRADEVVIAMEAAPINPSDLGLLFGPAKLAEARFEDGRVEAPVSAAALASLRKRVGEAMPVGNEGAGTVIAAGESAAAQALMGKRVAALPGGAFARYCLAPASACIVLPDDVSAEEGAAAFVNPLTALGFVETMRRDSGKAIVHTAAASSLGQMLLRICREDGIDLVNVVRSPEQVELLRGQGAAHVLNSKDDGYEAHLVEALAATGATVAFDPIGGGNQMGRILAAMEQVASREGEFSRYGSNVMKVGYVYGLLDTGPIVIDRFFGFGWRIGGWLLFPFLQSAGSEVRARLQDRIVAGLKTTFASRYSDRVSLRGMLSREAVMAYNARRTGEKFLVTPQA